MLPTETVTITAEARRSFATELFVAAKVPIGEATLVASSLVESNLCGHESHGVVRVAEYLGSECTLRLSVPIPDTISLADRGDPLRGNRT